MTGPEREQRLAEVRKRLRELTQEFSTLDHDLTDALEHEREFVLDALAEIDRWGG